MADEDTLTYLYSANKLTNGGAESEKFEGWDINGVTVVTGGTIMPPDTTGLKCFKFEADAFMFQEKSGTSVSPQPPDFKVAWDYLPETETDTTDPKNYAFMEINYSYGDGDSDQFVLPCRKQVEAEGVS